MRIWTGVKPSKPPGCGNRASEYRVGHGPKASGNRCRPRHRRRGGPPRLGSRGAGRPRRPRPDLLRRRQAKDGFRLGAAPQRGRVGWRSSRTARSSWSAAPPAATSRSPATTPTARSTRASPATASRRPTSGACERANAVALQPDGKIVAVGARRRRRRLRARPLQPERLARHELLRRRQADDRLRRLRRGERGRAPGERQDRRRSAASGRRRPAATSRSPATTRTARSTRASPATASRRPTSGAPQRGERGGAPGRRQDRRGRLRRLCRRLRPRPLQPQRLARHELLRRRQAEDRLRRCCRRGECGGAPARRQDRRGRLRPAPAPRDFALARYNANGSLDTSFSGDGKQRTDLRRPRRPRRAGWPSKATARSS